jgi:hypothetical protein
MLDRFGWKMQETAQNEAIKVYQATMSAQKDEIAGANGSIKKMQEAFAQLLPLVTELANSPAVPPTEPGRTNFNSSKPDPAEKINQIAEAIQNFKKNKN